MYAKTGNELVVESFYGFLGNQEMDGGQPLEVLANHAKIDRCFLNILNCERALGAIVLKYVKSWTLTFHINLYYLLQRKPFKNDEKCILFHPKSSFRSQYI